MKKALVVLAVVAFMAIAASLYAAQGEPDTLFQQLANAINNKGEVSNAPKQEPDTVFQKTADVIKGKYEVEVIPAKKVEVFQHMADGIKEGSAKAKNRSLRRTSTK